MISCTISCKCNEKWTNWPCKLRTALYLLQIWVISGGKIMHSSWTRSKNKSNQCWVFSLKASGYFHLDTCLEGRKCLLKGLRLKWGLQSSKHPKKKKLVLSLLSVSICPLIKLFYNAYSAILLTFKIKSVSNDDPFHIGFLKFWITIELWD